MSHYLFLLIQLIFVSFLDIKHKKISNYWSVINLVFFIICLIFFPEQYPLQFNILSIPVIIFVVTFVFFFFKIIGAGDSKYLTSFYLMVPIANQEDAFWLLTLSTFIIGTLVFLVNIFKNIDKIIISLKTANAYGIKQAFGSRFSFAPVVLVAWLWFGWVNRKIIFF